MSAPREGRPREDGPTTTPRGVATRRAFLALAGASAVLTTAACSGGGGPQASRSPGRGLSGRQVWAHMVPQGLPLSESGDIHYGSERPLSYAPAGTDYGSLVSGQIDQARAAGLTGMQILLLEGVNQGGDFVGDWMAAADPTWDEGEGFSVAPCLQVSSRGAAVRLLEQYAAAAEGHPSAARSGDALVVWLFNARSLSPQDWASCRGELQRKGTQLCLVAELGTAASQHGDRLDTSLIDPYGDSFEAVWLFEDKESEVLDDFVAWAKRHDTPFAGGTLPGYDRETTNGGYTDARATELWRTQLERQVGSGAAWLTAVTWNDAVEHTSVGPTPDWGTTRADVLAHHSTRFRSQGFPDDSATAYATTPQYLVQGQPLLAEGLGINHGTESVTVKVTVTTASGTQLAASEAREVAPGTMGAAVLEGPVDARGGEHLYAVVELTDRSRRRLARTKSAPVVVFAADDAALPDPRRRRYYSLSSASAAEFSDLARVEGAEGSPATTDGLKVVARESLRSVEFLHNTWPAGTGLNTRELTYRAPPDTLVGGQRIATVPQGFTLARVVTNSGKIAYSPPVHHAATADPGG